METLAVVNRIALAAASLFQAKQDVRVCLNGVHIKPAASPESGTGVLVTASDGHRVVCIYDPHGSAVRELIVQITSRVAATLKSRSEKTHAEIVGDEELGTLIRIPDEEYVASVQLLEGNYPDPRALFPKAPSASSDEVVLLNPNYLAALGPVSKCLSFSSRYAAVCVIPQPAKQASLFAFPNCVSDLVARAAIMPIFRDPGAADPYTFPEWCSTPPAVAESEAA